MSYSSPALTSVSQGLSQGTTTSFDPLVTGLPTSLSNSFQATPTNSASNLGVQPLPNSPLNPANIQALNSALYDASGRPVQPNSSASIDLGNGTVLSFDLNTLNAVATPALKPTGSLYDDVGESMFTASDCRIMVEIPQTPTFNGSNIKSRIAKQLIEITTLSVSSHRSKVPARAFGYINPRGFARGSRTIAGTMILSKTTAEVLYRFLQSGLMADLSKDTIYTKIDQLPPMDFTLLFSNEEGYISSQRLLGVEFVTDGTTISIQDVILEQQITWIAADFTPLTPTNFNTFFNVNTTASNATASQPTVGSILGKQQSQASSPQLSTTGAGTGVVTSAIPSIGDF